MASSNRESWEKTLRKSIPPNYGRRWYVIGENSGRPKLTYEYPNDDEQAKIRIR